MTAAAGSPRATPLTSFSGREPKGCHLDPRPVGDPEGVPGLLQEARQAEPGPPAAGGEAKDAALSPGPSRCLQGRVRAGRQSYAELYLAKKLRLPGKPSRSNWQILRCKIVSRIPTEIDRTQFW